MTKPTELDLHDFDKYSNCTFIHGCYIPHNICDDLVDYFDMNTDRHEKGRYIKGGLTYDINTKESTDIYFQPARDKFILEAYMNYLNQCVMEYEYKYHQASHMDSYFVTESVNLQKYEPCEGYHVWHCERKGTETQSRCLAFMTYLNDVPDGGTEFLYQQICSPAKRGLTMIWPSDWTHTHRGQISPTTTKYILTGWLNYTK
jgi:hypothetical protein